MTFDQYYTYIQISKNSTWLRLNSARILAHFSTTQQVLDARKLEYEQLLSAKLNHIEAVVESKITLIFQPGQLDVQAIRDFYHYFYYYLFYKGRLLLIHRDCYDCSWHRSIKNKFIGLIDPVFMDQSLDWLSRKYDHYYSLRTSADYYFHSRDITNLLNQQTLLDATIADWSDLKGLTL